MNARAMVIHGNCSHMPMPQHLLLPGGKGIPASGDVTADQLPWIYCFLRYTSVRLHQTSLKLFVSRRSGRDLVRPRRMNHQISWTLLQSKVIPSKCNAWVGSSSPGSFLEIKVSFTLKAVAGHQRKHWFQSIS